MFKCKGIIGAIVALAASLFFSAPASAGFITIDDSNLSTITVTAGQIEGGLYIDGQLLTSGYESNSITFNDGVIHTISGTWRTYGGQYGAAVDLLFGVPGQTTSTSGLQLDVTNSTTTVSPYLRDDMFSGTFGGFSDTSNIFSSMSATALQDGSTLSGGFAYLPITFISEVAPVPEPSTMLLLGGGLAGLAFWRKKKKN